MSLHRDRASDEQTVKFNRFYSVLSDSAIGRPGYMQNWDLAAGGDPRFESTANLLNPMKRKYARKSVVFNDSTLMHSGISRALFTLSTFNVRSAGSTRIIATTELQLLDLPWKTTDLVGATIFT